jgi:N-acetylglutamate synthase-like GNAT family acetyltransferase
MRFIKLFEEYNQFEPNDLVIRNVEESDYNTIIDDTIMYDDASKRDFFKRMINHQIQACEKSISYIAEINGKYVGCLLMSHNMITNVASEPILRGEIYNEELFNHLLETKMYEGLLLYVAKDYRGSLIHKKLLNAVAEKLKGEEVFAFTAINLNASNYWQHLGFEKVCLTKDPGFGAAYLFYKKL